MLNKVSGVMKVNNRKILIYLSDQGKLSLECDIWAGIWNVSSI